ncbi:TPA: hypothetical protein QDB48_000910 [Burkholderia vietnamiensis]|nr:hypothetical protein [Burkholderia vietnamiensis]
MKITDDMLTEWRTEFESAMAEECPEFQRNIYSPSDVEANVRAVAWSMWIASRRNENYALEALRQIANQDPVEMTLDPTWAKRIATEALKEKHHG